MPLLSAEPMFSPGDLFSPAGPAGADDRRWWVMHTRPRSEKALARHCHAHAVAYFLPQKEQRTRAAGGRVRVSHLPLFPNYVFVYGSADCRVTALESNQVANALPVADQPAFFDQLLAVHQVVSSGVDVLPEEGLRPGTPVVVVSGPLTGMPGKVLRQGTKCRLYVEIQMLNRGVSVEIEPTWCRPVPANAPNWMAVGR